VPIADRNHELVTAMRYTRNAGRKPKGKSAHRPVQIKSLTRALALIEAISQSDRGLTMSELARSVKLAPSTAHRLLNSLLAREFVDFDHESARRIIFCSGK